MTQLIDSAIYARVACNEESGLAIPDQIRACMSHADRAALRIPNTRVYSDAGLSGGTVTRPGLAQLIEDAQRVPRPFTVVLTRDISRLGRNLVDVLLVVTLLKSHGVSVYFVDEALSSSSPHFVSLLLMSGANDRQFLKALANKDREAPELRIVSDDQWRDAHKHRTIIVQQVPRSPSAS